MDESAVLKYLTQTFAGIQIVSADGNSFIYYAPDGKVPERTFPFATLVTKDDYDTASNLNRPGIFRLNIGVSNPTFLSLFNSQPAAPEAGGIVQTGHDFAALDQIMPHPVYGHLLWVCVLNPSEKTFESVQHLLAEAYETAVKKYGPHSPPANG